MGWLCYPDKNKYISRFYLDPSGYQVNDWENNCEQHCITVGEMCFVCIFLSIAIHMEVALSSLFLNPILNTKCRTRYTELVLLKNNLYFTRKKYFSLKIQNNSFLRQ